MKWQKDESGRIPNLHDESPFSRGKPKPKPNQHIQSHSHGACEAAKDKKMTEMTQSTRSSSKMKRSTSSSWEMKPCPKLVPSKSRSMR
ncbi:hypothetical protein D8674_004543 [Pyrus ussuriensis x Pyrus communis]|uniref:Uncharacterized protein n=1 Tax=Pyrus ussuriensis x Pyrus communis TaxID=2448454 RepID=A0A5N5FK73_9ROSA|nr:hypothetical protein D8674_004543 [Pyrus ussuriensis x Pyrus communis]